MHVSAKEELSDIAAAIHDSLKQKLGRGSKLSLDTHVVSFFDDMPVGGPVGIVAKEDISTIHAQGDDFHNFPFLLPAMSKPLQKQKYKGQIIREEAELKHWHTSLFHWFSLGHLFCSGAAMTDIVDAYMLGLLFAQNCVSSSLQFRTIFELKGENSLVQDQVRLSVTVKQTAIDRLYPQEAELLRASVKEQQEKARHEKDLRDAIKSTRNSNAQNNKQRKRKDTAHKDKGTGKASVNKKL